MPAFIATLTMLFIGRGFVLGLLLAAPVAAQTSLWQTPSGASYAHSQRRLASGTTVHEYIEPSGTVFAVGHAGRMGDEAGFLSELWAVQHRRAEASPLAVVLHDQQDRATPRCAP
mgnify:CR=1 FL=1